MNRKKIPPKLEWVKEYIKKQGYFINADEFYDYQESRGWYVGKCKMKCWQAAIRTWVRQQERFANETSRRNSNKGKQSNHARVCAALQRQTAT